MMYENQIGRIIVGNIIQLYTVSVKECPCFKAKYLINAISCNITYRIGLGVNF
jgi:hypothetical protein